MSGINKAAQRKADALVDSTGGLKATDGNVDGNDVSTKKERLAVSTTRFAARSSFKLGPSEWQLIRDAGKDIRRALTMPSQSSSNTRKSSALEKGADHYYTNFTKMEYRFLFAISSGMPKGFRNLPDAESLDALGYTEKTLARHIRGCFRNLKRHERIACRYRPDEWQVFSALPNFTIDKPVPQDRPYGKLSIRPTCRQS
jgi:hypothetical protein